MAKYSWNMINSLAGNLGFTEDQIESVHEAFKGPQRESGEFHDIAQKLHDLIDPTPSDPFVNFVPGSGEYKNRYRFALLFIVLLDWERFELALQKGEEENNDDLTMQIVEKIRHLFESGLFSVFALEAASGTFKDCMKMERSSEADKTKYKSRLESYGWLRQIFEKAELYKKLLTYFEQVSNKETAGADPFFLKLLLLYLDMVPVNSDDLFAYDPQKVIIGILTKNDRPGKESHHRSSKASLDYSRKMDDRVLSVFRDYASFLSDQDMKDLLDRISEELSERPGSMAVGSLDILSGFLSEKESVPKPCFRMRYIDAALLKVLCRTITENTKALNRGSIPEFGISIPDWGRGEVAFVMRNYRRLIRLDADESGVNMAFRGIKMLERSADEPADWDNKFLSDAASLCSQLLERLTKGSTFLFSFVYLRNYRSIGEFQVSFDHRYHYDSGTIKKENKELSSPYFYGSYIYSLTCLVGRNGAGKSSLVDFLRETFLAIIMDAEEKELGWNDGRPVLSDDDLERYGLKGKNQKDQHAEFFVIFKVEGKDLFLTNIDKNKISIDEGLDLSPYTPVMEDKYKAKDRCLSFVDGIDLTSDDCTLAYFSQFHYPTGMYSATHICEEKKYSERLSRYVRDLSEENFDRRAGETGINKDPNESLLHQMIFLMMRAPGARNRKGLPAAEECACYNDLEVISNTENVRFPLREAVQNQESLLKAVDDPEAFIGPLSSGQHTKIKLLSHLYWCLAGSKAFIKKYEKTLPEFCRIVSEYEDTCQNRLRENDTGILFFDEGDLCYHPEWQRSYLSDIVGMSSALRKKDVQVIVTTNSPFILSDILREDVFYPLGNENNDPGREFLPQTYGQNIHMLLAHPFFMKNTMGKMSEDTLIWFFNLFSKYKASAKKEEREALRAKVCAEVNNRFEMYLKKRADTENKFAEEESENIKAFLQKLAGSVGERTYRVALRDKYERCFSKKHDGG